MSILYILNKLMKMYQTIILFASNALEMSSKVVELCGREKQISRIQVLSSKTSSPGSLDRYGGGMKIIFRNYLPNLVENIRHWNTKSFDYFVSFGLFFCSLIRATQLIHITFRWSFQDTRKQFNSYFLLSFYRFLSWKSGEVVERGGG